MSTVSVRVRGLVAFSKAGQLHVAALAPQAAPGVPDPPVALLALGAIANDLHAVIEGVPTADAQETIEDLPVRADVTTV